MNVQSLNRERGYSATYNGVKGVLAYFYVYVNAWCFAPLQDVNHGAKYQPVSEEQISSMKIGRAI